VVERLAEQREPSSPLEWSALARVVLGLLDE
jgi:hypothetical protein